MCGFWRKVGSVLTRDCWPLAALVPLENKVWLEDAYSSLAFRQDGGCKLQASLSGMLKVHVPNLAFSQVVRAGFGLAVRR